MLNLNGMVSVEVMHELDNYTSLRLKDKAKYTCAEALGLYELRLLPNDEIYNICCNATGKKLVIHLRLIFQMILLHTFMVRM